MVEHVAKGERGIVRIFAVDLPEPELEHFTARTTGTNGKVRWPLQEALGVPVLDEDFIEQFPMEDLAELGLSGYLSEGYDIPDDALSNVSDALDAIAGNVLLIWSEAFGGAETILVPSAPLRHVATLQEPQPEVQFEPLPNKSAKREPEDVRNKPAISDAAMSGRIALIALLVAFFAVGLMIWIGSG